MIHLLSKLVVLIGSMIVLLYTIEELNRMCAKSDHGRRIAHILLAVGSFYQLLQLMAGHIPSLATCLMVSGMAGVVTPSIASFLRVDRMLE